MRRSSRGCIDGTRILGIHAHVKKVGRHRRVGARSEVSLRQAASVRSAPRQRWLSALLVRSIIVIRVVGFAEFPVAAHMQAYAVHAMQADQQVADAAHGGGLAGDPPTGVA